MVYTNTRSLARTIFTFDKHTACIRIQNICTKFISQIDKLCDDKLEHFSFQFVFCAIIRMHFHLAHRHSHTKHVSYVLYRIEWRVGRYSQHSQRRWLARPRLSSVTIGCRQTLPFPMHTHLMCLELCLSFEFDTLSRNR